jgi:hypothetical protein
MELAMGYGFVTARARDPELNSRDGKLFFHGFCHGFFRRKNGQI